jgi:hypothetical protein
VIILTEFNKRIQDEENLNKVIDFCKKNNRKYKVINDWNEVFTYNKAYQYFIENSKGDIING